MAGFRETIEGMAAGRVAPSPYDALTGIRVVSVSPGASHLRVEVGPRFHNPAQVVHGGVVSGLVDSAMAYAVAGHLGPEETCTNIDLTIRFLRGTVAGALEAFGRVLRAGRTVLVVSCDVKNEAGELVATASSSFLRLAAKAGAGWLAPQRDPEP